MHVKLSETERRTLLRLARTAIARAIGAGDAEARPTPFEPPSMAMLRPACAFVSLHVGQDLRGCIGHLEPDAPLTDVVQRCAVSAALSDPRFSPVSPAEWSRVALEISVLGLFEVVADIAEIEVGRHGLIAEHCERRGLLLPQVAIEWGWNREEFVEQTCRKAGLPKDAWSRGAKLFKFEADVFGEDLHHRGH